MRSNLARLVAPVALSLGTLGGGVAIASVIAPTAGAVVAKTAMAPVTETGKITKIISGSSFTMTVKKTSYVVKADAMTHVKDGSMMVKFSKLKKGETVTVKGPLDMKTISATSIVIGM